MPWGQRIIQAPRRFIEGIMRKPRPTMNTIAEEYSDEEREFMMAMDRYKREKNRPYPTCKDILEVARKLGYRKTQEDQPCRK